jgi:hypothetical protein
MSAMTLTRAQHNLVVFLLWRALPYPVRMLLGFGGILGGLALQVAQLHLLPGCLLVLLGNALLLVRGYHNRVDAAAYDARAEWERVDAAQVQQIKTLHQRMKRWDRSATDISNILGGFMLALLAGAVVLLLAGSDLPDMWKKIIGVNAAILLLPHWLTGTRRLLTQPSLLIKIAVYDAVLQGLQAALTPHAVEFYVLLKGKKTRMPQDVKFRVRLTHQKERFLGLYGQAAINTVQGHSYPYFYAVLVAKKNFGLDRLKQHGEPPRGMLREFSQEGDVEVLVVRQTTTKTSGYYTRDNVAQALMAEGLRMAEAVAVLDTPSPKKLQEGPIANKE